AVTNSLPAIVSVVTFVVYSMMGNTLTPSKVFTALALFNQLRFPLMFYPMVLSYLADTRISLSRLQPFFQLEEASPLPFVPQTPTIGDSAFLEHPVISVENSTFTWKSVGSNTSISSMSGAGYLLDVELMV